MTTRPMHVLVVAFEDPDNANNGGSLDTSTRLQWLRQFGAEVATIAWSFDVEKSTVELSKLLLPVSRTWQFRAWSALRWARGIPILAALRHPNKAATTSIRDFSSSFAPDVILLESPFCAATADAASKHGNVPVVLRMHDETTKYLQNVRPPFLWRRPKTLLPWLLGTARLLFTERWEAQVIGNAAVVNPISEAVAQYVVNMQGDTSVQLLRPLRELHPPARSTAEATHDLVFAGNLYQPNNVRSIRWLIDEVMPEVWAHDPSVSLLIAGSTGPRTPTTFSDDARIDVRRDYPPGENPLLDGNVMVNPQLLPGGASMKMLAPIELGMPIVSTSAGAQGLPAGLFDGGCEVHADTPADFGAACMRALRSGSGTRANRTEVFEAEFGAAAAQRWFHSLTELIGHSVLHADNGYR